MSETRHYDAAIIGTGQGGKPLAAALAGAGYETAIIERGDVGGSCINEGCTPTKTMVASARVAYLARRAADYGVETGPVNVNLKAVRQRKRDIVERFSGGSEKRLRNTENLDLLMGEARFTGPRELEVDLNGAGSLRLTADRVFINTGTRPSVPPIEALEAIPFLDNRSVMELDKVPDHLLVLGGGYVGLEFGQMFRRFGSEVTIVQRGPQLLPREDEDVAEGVADVLREDGIEVLLGTMASGVTRSGNGEVRLKVLAPKGERTLEGSHLLVASGRVPNTDQLNLKAAGIKTDEKGFVMVDEWLETSMPGVWAMGDVKGGPAFTHISYDDFRVIRANLLDGAEDSVEGRPVSYTVYIDPQLGRVGLSAKEARERGLNFKIAKMPMKHVARALETDESRGLMKVLVEAENDRILGAAILGIEGGELMSMVHLAMLGDMPFTVLRDAPFAHPTLAESFNNLFATI
ncbi:MAG: mercuric reductase [Actinomycetota bacterium]|nr:mercuric reductase [Actinomycetota bacterium]